MQPTVESGSDVLYSVVTVHQSEINMRRTPPSVIESFCQKEVTYFVFVSSFESNKILVIV